MRAKDVMTTEVVTVGPETTVAGAAALMLSRHISGVPVVDSAGRLAGILTEGDLMRRAELVTERRPWFLHLDSSAEEQARVYTKAYALRVKDVMTRDVATIDEKAPLDRIAMLFEAQGIKRAPVVQDGRLVGIVSRANLLQGLASAGRTDETGPNDREIRAAILSAAVEEAGARTPLVGATVSDGVVHLWGNVASEAESDAIRVVAETAEGVREVHSHLRVLPLSVVEWSFE